MKSQYWPRGKINEFQEERLRDVFTDASRVPYWKDMVSSLSASGAAIHQLARFPVTTKKELVEAGEFKTTDPAYAWKSDQDRTSGSTGRPFSFYTDWGASLRSYAVTERIFRTLTKGTRYPIVYMRSRERNGFTFWKHTWLYSKGQRDVAERIDELVRISKNFKNGFVLYAYTSSLLEVARQVEARRLELPLRAAMAAGEHLTNAQRQYIERVLKTQVFTMYASREAGYLAFECEFHTLHLNEEWAYVEIVDEHGTALPYGKEGRIVVTTFDNRAMPFIRYDIGDRGVMSDVACQCGRTLRTIELKGRTAELIELSGGRRVALLDTSSTIDRFWDAVRQFQLVQTGVHHFTMRVVPGPSFASRKMELEAALTELFGEPISIMWEFVETIPDAPSGKAQYFLRTF